MTKDVLRTAMIMLLVPEDLVADCREWNFCRDRHGIISVNLE